MTLAQLAVQRSGQLDWLRRSARQLWTITPDDGNRWSAQQSAQTVGEGSWLGAEPDGRAVLVSAPAQHAGHATSAGHATVAAVRHPRSGAWFLAGASSLVDEVRARSHPLAARAMTLSADLHRLYAVTITGELYVLAASAYRQVLGEPVSDEPELLLSGLDAHGAPSGLALGPAGLVLATDRAVVGINLRSRSVAPILADLAAHSALAALRAPVVAMDHRRNLYLADEHLVVCAPAFGTPPVICSDLR